MSLNCIYCRFSGSDLKVYRVIQFQVSVDNRTAFQNNSYIENIPGTNIYLLNITTERENCSCKVSILKMETQLQSYVSMCPFLESVVRHLSSIMHQACSHVSVKHHPSFVFVWTSVIHQNHSRNDLKWTTDDGRWMTATWKRSLWC